MNDCVGRGTTCNLAIPPLGDAKIYALLMIQTPTASSTPDNLSSSARVLRCQVLARR